MIQISSHQRDGQQSSTRRREFLRHALGATALVARVVRLYGQLGAGIAVGRTSFTDTGPAQPSRSRERFFGYHVAIAGGLQIVPPSWPLGFFVEVGYTYAPIIENLVGETHDSGGATILAGVRFRTKEKP